MRKFLVYIALTLSALALFPSRANGQFKKDAFTQTYANPNDTTQRDSVDTMFSFKEFFGGVVPFSGDPPFSSVPSRSTTNNTGNCPSSTAASGPVSGRDSTTGRNTRRP